ncbi:MAG: cytochrome c biogenesis protein CcsA [Gemmataceae bacterium]|nr:cytochrome c biogenesis protein [Gemmata sp.]MDW8196197.1 cytochrome c biogenesis protein CcsA [Gemmataceae bacterium]
MSVSPLQGVTHACFALSYLCALLLEIARLLWPATGWRLASLAFGGAGIVAHTAYILYNQPTPAAPYGSLLLLAWVLALFYIYGTIHHAKQAWAVFVLPVVLGLVVLSLVLVSMNPASTRFHVPDWAAANRFWGAIHGLLLLLGAVGVSVSFVASVMYLMQARRLRNKVLPDDVAPILSLERLETMNRRALNIAFPLLTAGLFLGSLLLPEAYRFGGNWLSVKVVSTAGLWLVFLLLVYLRYGVHVPARRLAWLSILAFGLLLMALVASHPFAVGGGS